VRANRDQDDAEREAVTGVLVYDAVLRGLLLLALVAAGVMFTLDALWRR
jgi:hypothetical protein